MADLVERTTALLALRPGRETAVAEALGRMGASLPAMGRFVEAGGLLLARVAPYQLLAMRAGVDLPLLDELAPLAGSAGIIDLSDSRVGVRLAGPGARERLAALVPLDLHASRFAPGHCAPTLMAHLSVLLLQTGPAEYEVQCGRSFAGSFLRAVGGAAEHA